jgi:hypothetical protein
LKPIYIVALAAAAVVVALYLVRRRGGGARAGRDQAEALYQNLLRKSFGDRGGVARLIELERQRRPDATEIELMKSAIARWERHNR